MNDDKRVNKRRNRKGFTIVEVLVAIALIGIVMTMAVNLIIIPTNVHDEVTNEFDIQSKLRIVSQTVNSIIRDASATFALHRLNHDNLTPGWNYLIPSMDISSSSSTSIIEYLWDEDTNTHIRKVVAEPIPGVTYSLVFTKLNPSYADKLIEYEIVARINGQSREVNSEVEALNSLQVVDRGNTTYPSNAIAFRTDARPNQIADEQAAISMVLDISYSMNMDMNGNSTSNNANKRITKLKTEAIRLINSLSASANIFVSIVPFNNHANGAQPMLPARVNATANLVLINQINNLNVSSVAYTNTGDGMRRGFYMLDEFNQAAAKKTNNFMVILTDGVTNHYSVLWADKNSYGQVTNKSFLDGNNTISGEVRYNVGHTNTSIGYYAGTDADSIDSIGTEYIRFIGGKIRSYGSGSTADKEPIKVYVIGFSAEAADHGSLGDIALATSGNSTFYVAGDSAALEAIFGAIQKDISDSLWHIGGPN
jgi:prepilin-type N-terminal cleavage/methylation domain-containing protein